MPIYPLADFEILSVLFWSVVTLALIAGAFLGVKALNKWMAADDVGDIGAGFSLSDLRELVKTGKMSQEEFEKAKAILLASAQKSTATPKSTGRTQIPPGGQ